MDPDAWTAHLAADVVMRFANEDPVYGRAACRAQVVSLFRSVTSVSHHLIERWEHGDATILEVSITFGLPDGTDVAIPVVMIHRADRYGLITDYRVYLDPSPLWP